MKSCSALRRVGLCCLAAAVVVCGVGAPGSAEETLPLETEMTQVEPAVIEPPIEDIEIPESESSNDAPREATEQETLTVYELQQQKAQLQQQALDLQAARRYYSSSLEDLLKQKESIEQEIKLKQQELTVNAQLKKQYNQQIWDIESEIIDNENALLTREAALRDRYQQLRMQLRNMSKRGTLTTFQMLFSTTSFLDYLINAKMVQRLAVVDQQLIDDLERELTAIRSDRRLLEEKRQQLEEQRAPYVNAESDLEQNKAELMALRTQATQIANQINSNITYYRMQYSIVAAQQLRVQNQINEIIKGTSLVNSIATSVMYWPAPGCTVITSSFKLRDLYGTGDWRQHSGVDICAWGDSANMPIMAAADGVVVFTGYDANGYGNYAMIDHGYDAAGRRIITLYGHANMLYVEQGETVIGGSTVIGAIGSTGNSTGDHLHFEVRVDDTAIDPVENGYLQLDGITVLA